MVITVEETDPIASIKDELVRIFQKLDAMIAIHFQTNYLSNLIKFEDISKKIVGLTLHHILKIKKIYKESYCLAIINDDLTIDAYCEDELKKEDARINLLKLLNSRLDHFKTLFDEFVATSGIKIKDLSDIPNYKIVKGTSKNILPFKITRSSKNQKLSNKISKFEFKEKKDPKTKGATKLSLLERIRLKEASEKANKENNPVDDTRDRYLHSKMNFIYDILYEQSPKISEGSSSSYCVQMGRLKLLVKDSSQYEMTDGDITDVIRKISTKVENMKIVKVGELEVLKIGRLNRDNDLKILKD